VKERRPCEALEHVRGCNGKGTTKDHFTPQCIGEVLGWSKAQINSPENIQYLSPACHEAKDRTTPQRLQEVIFQECRGGTIKFGEHLQKEVKVTIPPKKRRKGLVYQRKKNWKDQFNE
jgi:hypothetical protein